MKRLNEALEDHKGRLSSKRVLAFLTWALVPVVIVRYIVTGDVDIPLVVALLTASGGYLGITIFDRKNDSSTGENV
jgi:hypothetical protein